MTPTADHPGHPDDEASDIDLLAAHVAGDPDAFGELVRRHRDRLWAVALRTTGNPEDAADGLQDGLVAAFRRAGTFRGDAAVTTWLHRVVVNACLDRLRAAKVRRADPLPDDLDDAGSLAHPETGDVRGPGAAGDPVAAAVADERRTAVLRALATLPAEQRAALVLVDMEGYPVTEVALMLDCAVGTVKSRCSRGRARLAEVLADLLDVASDTPSRSGPRSWNPGPRPDVPSTDDPVTAPPDPAPSRAPGPAAGRSPTS